jgi:hypothetical protein
MRSAISGYPWARKAWRSRLRIATLAGVVALAAVRFVDFAVANDKKVLCFAGN